MQVRTAVIPAAGYGTRFLPLSKAIPKEMLPLIDRPVIQYAVEEAVSAGIERIVLVTSTGKEAIERYFQVSDELEALLEKRSNTKLEDIRRISRLVNVESVVQEQALGLGHAILCARQAVGNAPFIVYLPDEIFRGSPSATEQVLSAFDQLGTSIIGVKEVPLHEVERYGVVGGESVSDRYLRLRRTVEKPEPESAPSNLAIFGPYVFTPAIFECLESIKIGAVGELQLTDGIDLLAKRERVHACKLDVSRYDAGTPLGLLETAIELALDRPDYRDDLKAWLKDLMHRLD